MKVAARSLSLLILVFLASHSLFSQQAFVVEKKYDIFKVNRIIQQDSSQYTNKNINPFHYNMDHLAIFCRIEEKVAKKSNINMRLRLGSLDYVNYLEQKPNWQLPINNQ